LGHYQSVPAGSSATAAASVTRLRKSRAALDSTPLLVTELALGCFCGYAKRSHLLPGSIAMARHWLSANVAGIDEDNSCSCFPAATPFIAYDFGLGSGADQNKQSSNHNRRSHNALSFLIAAEMQRDVNWRFRNPQLRAMALVIFWTENRRGGGGEEE
jgi:hypothetical protein